MFAYLLKRFLYFIPTFLLISLIVFFLSKCAGDSLQCENNDLIGYDEATCIKEAQLKGYDKPLFYFALSTAAHPDTLHHIFRKTQRLALSKLIGQYGNWEAISAYHQQLRQLDRAIEKTSRSDNSNVIIKMRQTVGKLYSSYKAPIIESQIKKLSTLSDSTTTHLLPTIVLLSTNFQTVQKQATPNKLLWPAMRWHGFDNQYHRWLSNFLSGDLGVSNRDFQSVSAKIWARLPWTLALTLPAIFLAYFLSIPLGIYTAKYKDSNFDKWTNYLLLLVYSLPVFWIATLLVNFFTTPEYGMKIFPSIGVSSLPDSAPFFERLLDNATHLILPIICLTYGSVAVMTRLLRSSMITTLQQDFIRTARAKGLNEQRVFWKHAFKNSIFPFITLFGNVLPGAFAGSVVIEVIFNIQGMGYLMWNSIFARDWPVVYGVLMIAAVLTVVGILLADILYAVVDPRVKFGKR